VEVSRSPARDAQGKTLYFVISERDITEERALTARLSHQALHDPLTGLANRALFLDRLAQAHSRVVRQGGMGAVLLLDLDDFKGVNDTHGDWRKCRARPTPYVDSGAMNFSTLPTD
jgi:PleD family two-component response regulator